MRLALIPAVALASLAASLANAQGLASSPEEVARPGPNIAVPDGTAEPLAGIVIEETIKLAPTSGPAAAVAGVPERTPNHPVVTPTAGRESTSAAVLNSYAAVDAGPTFMPPASAFAPGFPGPAD